MATNFFTVLGIPESAEEEEIHAAFQAMDNALHPSNFSANNSSATQAQRALATALQAYAALSVPEFRKKHAAEMMAAGEPFQPAQLKPFIGHLCVAAGIINYSDLAEAIDKQTDIDLPLGQILQEKRLLSQTELEGMLMGQQLYGAPISPIEPMTKRLLALGIVNLDMVRIVLIDQRTAFGKSLDELLVKRGYVEPEIIQALKSR